MSQDGYVPGGYGIGGDVVPHGSQGKQVIFLLPKNPSDRSTVVSIIPKVITETKATIFPSTYVVPKAPIDGFALLVVGSASWFMANQNEKLPPIEVQVNSWQLAESICLDYNSGILECNMNDRMPGLFCIPGEWDQKSILKFTDRRTGRVFDQMLADARWKQKNWFMALINQSDGDWAQSGGNPRVISDDARMAADILKLDKPWMQNTKAFEMTDCPYCGELINPKFPVCKHCNRVVNAEAAANLDKMFGNMVKVQG